ncbi:MAG: DNA recombination protein RmuC [Peptococcaceae bacterium]|nr:DNA recombination protein RmuC [Peptococcaceae bacterium]
MQYVYEAVSFFFGCLLVWALTGGRARAAAAEAADLRRRLEREEEELRRARDELGEARTARAAAEARLDEYRKKLTEQQDLLAEATKKLGDTFQALAYEALRDNNRAFLDLARKTMEGALQEARGDLGRRQEAIASLVAPLREAIERYDREVREMEKARREAYGSLTGHLEELARTHHLLQAETRKLVSALRAPQARGRWGEITLQRVVEVAGMSRYCDFVTQPAVEDESGRKRPDLIVRLPGGRTIVVDAKAPLNAYLDGLETEEEQSRNAALARHAQAVRSHMAALGSKEYQRQFTPGPDFVVLFLPGESFFAAALEQDRTLIEDGIARRVILATPTTLIALLRAVAHSWQQHQATENARKIIEAGTDLYERICKFAEHLGRVGDGLGRALDAYNAAVGSWTARLAPGARRLKELGAALPKDELKEVKPVHQLPREMPGINGS